MRGNLALVRKAQNRFRLMNRYLFDNCLPRIRIEVKEKSSKYDGTFVSFNPPETGKPYIILYKNIDDEILLHEMIHYLLYIGYLDEFFLSGQNLSSALRFRRKYGHTKEFWRIHQECLSRLI